MAKDKVTITLDRSKAELARGLVGASSTSEVIDLALERLILAERLRQDVEAYRRLPQSSDELGLTDEAARIALEDDVDWASLYADSAR
jgi:hypothetical protein